MSDSYNKTLEGSFFKKVNTWHLSQIQGYQMMLHFLKIMFVKMTAQCKLSRFKPQKSVFEVSVGISGSKFPT